MVELDEPRISPASLLAILEADVSDMASCDVTLMHHHHPQSLILDLGCHPREEREREKEEGVRGKNRWARDGGGAGC